MGTAFTYQGQLVYNGAPVNDTCDFTFSLWDEAGSGEPPMGGNQINSDVTLTGVGVSDGLFTVSLDFGTGAFTGDARWLEIDVDCSSISATLSPRQPLTPVPYSLNAVRLDGEEGAYYLDWSHLTNVPDGFADGTDDGPIDQLCPVGRQLSGLTSPGDILCEESPSFAPGSIFVAPNGDDTSSCLDATEPCQTISMGLVKAQNGGGPQVVVALGVYFERIALANGIDLLGGYNASFTVRDTGSLQAIIKGDGTDYPTVTAAGIVTPTILEGFIIEGPLVTAQNKNSIAIHISNCTDALSIHNNVVIGGVAGNGAQGDEVVISLEGIPGAGGTNALEYPEETSPSSTPGGSGGILVIDGSDNISGGNGGAATAPVYTQQAASGIGGLGAAGGAGGSGGYDARLGKHSPYWRVR